MLRIAVRAVREHLVRFALSLLAVALGVAFVAGTFALRQMLSSTFDDIVSTSLRADAYVEPAGSDSGGSADATFGGSVSQGVPLTLVDQLAAVDGVRAAFPELRGSVVLVGADGTAVTGGRAPSFAMALDPSDPSAAKLVGHAPTGSDQIAVEAGALARSGLKVGDATRIVIGGQIRDVTVTGSLDWGAATAGATLVFVDEDTALQLFAPTGTVPSIAVYADPAAGLDQSQLVGRISAVASATGAHAVTRDALADQTTAAIDSSLGFVSTFLLVFAALALFVGTFIIANTFTMTVRQRLREFALLRAVGASPLQVFVSIVVQAAVIGLIGSAIGLVGGLGLVTLLRVVFARFGTSLNGAVTLTPGTAALCLAVGTVVSVVASVLPARRAALVPPVEAMRDELVVRDRSLTVRAAIGAALALAGAGGAVWVVRHAEAAHAGALLGASAGAVLIGILALGPVLAPAAVRVLAWPVVAAVRPLGRLARGNVTRNPRRTANTAGALTIGMALVGAAAVLAASTQASVSTVVADEVHADLVLRVDQPQTVPSDLIASARTTAGVAGVYPIGYGAVEAATGTPSDADDVYLAGLDPAAIGSALRPAKQSTSLAPVLSAGEAVVDADLAKDRGWSVGQQLTVVGRAATTTVRIGATMTSGLIGSAVLVSPAVFDTVARHPVDESSTTALVVATPGTDVAGLRATLTDQAKQYIVASVMTGADLATSLSRQVQQVLVILYALLGLSVLIAGLGIVNTLALSVIERTREIGLLRAVGLGRLQLAGTITIESVLTALSGTVLGLAVGVGLAATLPKIYASQGLQQLSVPWTSLVAMLALAIVVGVIAALWPGVRAARLRVLDAISYE